MTTATAIAIFHEKAYAAKPAAERVRKISSGAYATEESASLAKTGSAIRFGSRVSPSRSLRRARPTRSRLRTPPGKGTRTMVASGLRAQCAAAPEHRGLADLRPSACHDGPGSRHAGTPKESTMSGGHPMTVDGGGATAPVSAGCVIRPVSAGCAILKESTGK